MVVVVVVVLLLLLWWRCLWRWCGGGAAVLLLLLWCCLCWLPVVVQGDTEGQLAASMRGLEEGLARAAEEGRVTGRLLPSAMVPDPARQAANLPVLTRLAAARKRLEGAMDTAGFSPTGMAFSRKVLETWENWGRNPVGAVRWPPVNLLEGHLESLLRRDSECASVCGFLRRTIPMFLSEPLNVCVFE